jgi:hypothetical protein
MKQPQGRKKGKCRAIQKAELNYTSDFQGAEAEVIEAGGSTPRLFHTIQRKVLFQEK